MSETLEITKISALDSNVSESTSRSILKQRFNSLCTRLIEKINQHKSIPSMELGIFSRCIRQVICTSLDIESAPYEDLTKYLKEYWHYELNDDGDKKRVCSYTQLYQMICMMQQKRDDLEAERKAHAVARKEQYFPELIKQIQQTPGITFNDLEGTVQIASSVLDQQLKTLEIDKLVIGKHDGERRSFVLTASGRALYRDLYTTSCNKWVDNWSSQRLYVFVALVKLLQELKPDESTFINTVVDFVSGLNEDQTVKLYFSLKEYNLHEGSKRCSLNNTAIPATVSYDINSSRSKVLHILISEEDS